MSLLNFFPNDEQAAQAVMRRVHAREQAKLRAERKAVGGWSLSGARGVRMPDGLRASFRCPTNSYHFWGKKLGYECWEDAGFVHEFLRDNPQCRIQNEAFRMLSGWTPGSSFAKGFRRERDKLLIGAAAPGKDAGRDACVPGGRS